MHTTLFCHCIPFAYILNDSFGCQHRSLSLNRIVCLLSPSHWVAVLLWNIRPGLLLDSERLKLTDKSLLRARYIGCWTGVRRGIGNCLLKRRIAWRALRGLEISPVLRMMSEFCKSSKRWIALVRCRTTIAIAFHQARFRIRYVP